MTLRLIIDGVATLSDGGPTSFTATGEREIYIGRDPNMDWVLPDPNRVVSSRHCEIRVQNGQYWLHDTSTNGTYVNQAQQRLAGPHRLASGDIIEIGPYVIHVEMQEDNAEFGDADATIAPFSQRQRPERAASDPAVPRQTTRNVLQERRPSPADAHWIEAQGTQGEGIGRQGTNTQPLHEHAGDTSEPLPGVPQQSGTEEFLSRFAAGAGIDPTGLYWHDPGQLAERVGGLLQLCAHHLSQLLLTRAQFKRRSRARNQTDIRLSENNPLRWLPSTHDALSVMFGRPTRSFLDAERAFAESFETVQSHQAMAAAAMQQAMQALLADLDPAVIEKEASARVSPGWFFRRRTRKAQLWDEFAARWKAKAGAPDQSMQDAFMLMFSDAYDRLAEAAETPHAPPERPAA